MAATNQQVVDAIAKVANIIEETVNESGPMGVPSGLMYAAMMTTGMSLESYQTIINVMVAEGRISQSGDLLKAVK